MMPRGFTDTAQACANASLIAAHEFDAMQRHASLFVVGDARRRHCRLCYGAFAALAEAAGAAAERRC